jgi:predicted DNA-binding transcriptional regulator YafY
MTATALYVTLQTSHRIMPNLMFEPDELRDIVVYILSLKESG